MQLGVLDLLLTQLLISPEEVQLAVTVANLTLVDDEVKQTMCTDEDLQIFETLVFAFRNLCTKHSEDGGRGPAPLDEADLDILELSKGISGVKGESTVAVSHRASV